jgi:AraC-like DNA-binding protein
VVTFQLGDALPRHVVEYLVARTAISLRRSGAIPREVRFRHACAGEVREYERVLRGPVRFEQSTTALALREEDLLRPVRTANPEAAAALSAGLARMPWPGERSAAHRLVAAVEEALARGADIEREALARSLGMSGKTLARRLAAERKLFRDVVGEVRRALAERLVAEERFSLEEVATRVGFGDLSTFGKAFRRWFGVSPSAFRARRRSS